ncbi:MAG TPA: HEAT repeat domain-containing protein, partial [Edaphobacter sp.]|nr:HEAT repeat domain-containing protein [Edaphobacter sp.]
TAPFAVKGLERIDTAESRADLVDLFERSFDLRLRTSIVLALAEMNSSDQLSFFASLLPGHSSEAEERIREFAALAIGRLGGDGGVDQLASFLTISGSQASPGLRSAIAIALASGRSKKAVPVLINLYDDDSDNGLVQNSVCGSLESLTHRNWCVRASGQPDYQTPWPDWWRRNAATTNLYGFDQCIKPSDTKPLDD